MLSVPTIVLPTPGVETVTAPVSPLAFSGGYTPIPPDITSPSPDPVFTLSLQQTSSPFPFSRSPVELNETFPEVAEVVQTKQEVEEWSAVVDYHRVIPAAYRRMILSVSDKEEDGKEDDWVPFCITVLSVEGLVEAQDITTNKKWVGIRWSL